mmetsp:Transcript_37367/g.64491  ORF Transcript_37367/g.64491 Transcript_37367/m.64491 type:complete len:98 (-) Transcript_37367:45-338(-)
MSGSYSRDQFAAAAQVSQVRTSHSNSRPPPSLHRHVGAPICLICLVPTIDSSGDSNNFITCDRCGGPARAREVATKGTIVIAYRDVGRWEVRLDEYR